MQLKKFYWTDIFVDPLSKRHLRQPLYLRCYVEQVEVRFIFGREALLKFIVNKPKSLEKQAWRARIEAKISSLIKENKEFTDILRQKLQAEWDKIGIRLSRSIPIFSEDLNNKDYRRAEKNWLWKQKNTKYKNELQKQSGVVA